MARSGFYSVDSLNGVHVLLVGDDAEARELLAAVLRYCGAFVTVVATAAGALEVMERIRADVLVVQLDTTDAGGATLVRQVRALKPENGGVVPAVAVQPPDSNLSSDTLRAAGFDASVAMPVDPWALCRLVSNLVSPS